MDDAADAELVQHIARGGSFRAIAETALCRRFAPRVRLYGLKHLRDEDRARDLVQTVLVGVLQAARAGRIEDAVRLDRFVLGTCRNTVARMREQSARAPLAHEDAVDALVGVSSEPLDLAALFGCITRLDERAQAVVMASFLEDRSADEIAVQLATTPGNVRVLRSRALAALRGCLDGKVQP